MPTPTPSTPQKIDERLAVGACAGQSKPVIDAAPRVSAATGREGDSSAAVPPPPGSTPATAIPPEVALRAERIGALYQKRLDRFHALVAGGLTRTQAASEVGHALCTIWKLEHRLKTVGHLQPNYRVAPGRSMLAGLETFLPSTISELQRLAVTTGSIKHAARLYAADPLCPTALANYIVQRGRLPERLHDLIDLHRGKVTCRRAGAHIFIEEFQVTARSAVAA